MQEKGECSFDDLPKVLIKYLALYFHVKWLMNFSATCRKYMHIQRFQNALSILEKIGLHKKLYKHQINATKKNIFPQNLVEEK